MGPRYATERPATTRVWDPLWLVGGLLLLFASRGFQKSPQAGRARPVGGVAALLATGWLAAPPPIQGKGR